MNKGLLFALSAALISGVSIYINKFGVAQISDPFVFTTLKNSVVALGFLALIGLGAKRRELLGLSSRQKLGLIALGLIGGGIPFLLFFQGLALTPAADTAILQKTLFIWVALLAVPFLGERLGPIQVLGLAALTLGQYLLQPPSVWAWTSGHTLILIATLMWAVETIVAKKVLLSATPALAASSRMGIGALVMWAFLFTTGRAANPLTLGPAQWFWVILTSGFLFIYITAWYCALALAPATMVTSVLALGAVITAILSQGAGHQAAGLTQAAALILTIGGVAIYAGLPVHPQPAISP